MCCSLLAVSCQEEEMGFSQEEIFRGTYERSFVNQFGNIDPNQTWDFSPYGRLYANNSAVTRAVDYKGTTYPPYFEPIEGWEDETTHTPNTYYEVPSKLLEWMDNNILDDGANTGHSKLISGNFSFVWQAGQVLEILPVWQGDCGQVYSLSILMDDEEEVIWERNDGMEIQNSVDGDWIDISTTGNFKYRGTTYKLGYTGSSTVGIRVKPILITDDMLKGMGVTNPDLQELKLKLNITTGMGWKCTSSEYSCDGDYATSTGVVHCDNKTTGTQSRIGLINIPSDSIDVPEGYQKWLLGCEDAMHSSVCDWDYNDVVFLIAGKVTEPIYKEGEVERTIEKRYMVEDLTGYADFDFNDIVVDLKETYKLKYKKDEWDGVITWDTTRYNRKQVATIKHLCGTVPMQVKIGNYSLPKITNPVDQEQTKKELAGETVDAKTFWENPDQRKVGSGWSPNASFELTNLNWNVDRNNLSVSVWTNKEGDTQSANYTPWTATFPAAGKVPYIIATDVKREWLPEMTNATQEWWDALNSNTTY